MSRNSNRLCQLTGSLFLITAGATPASAGLLGGLLGSSTDDSIVQTNQDRDPAKGYFSEPFAEPTIIVDGEAWTGYKLLRDLDKLEIRGPAGLEGTAGGCGAGPAGP